MFGSLTFSFTILDTRFFIDYLIVSLGTHFIGNRMVQQHLKQSKSDCCKIKEDDDDEVKVIQEKKIINIYLLIILGQRKQEDNKCFW